MTETPQTPHPTIQSIHKWLDDNQIKNEKGERIDFFDHLFLFHIYADQSPNIVIKKAAQVGLSTLAINKNIYEAKTRGLDIIYTLPTDSDVSVFVGGKVNRIIANNPIMLEYTADKDSIEQKQVGDHMVYFRGTWTKKAAIMITADRLVHDEKDSSKQDVIADYKARLQHSKFKEIHVFSHPSTPNTGVDVEWQQSDQKEWVIHCPHCQKRQNLTWDTEDERKMSIDLDRAMFVCKFCRGELSDDDRRDGRWLARKDKEHAEWSGYHVSLLMAPWVTAQEIIKKYNEVVEGKQTMDFFYNKVLGEPYAGSGNSVTEEQILGSITDQKNDYKGRLVIGVDTGVALRYVIGNKQGLVGYGQMKDYSPDDKNKLRLEETLEYFLKKFPDSIMVIDQGGDIIGSRKLAAAYPGRVFLCHYGKDRKTMELIRWGKADESGNVIVDRNRMMQVVIGEISERRWRLFGTENDWYNYWLHWSHIYRTVEMNNLERPEYVWRRSDRDDWCFAAGTLVATKHGQIPIEKIKPGDHVFTRLGYRRVLASGITNQSALVKEYQLGQRKIISTPTHPLWTSKGWVDMDASVCYTTRICALKQSSSTELSSDDTRTPSGELSVSILPPEGTTEKKVSGIFTKKFGGTILGKYQKVLSYTIKTIIRSTMLLETLSVKIEPNTSETTTKNGLQILKIDESKSNTLPKSSQLLTNGEKRQRGRNGIVRTLSVVLFWLSQKALSALNAVVKPLLEVEQVAPFALQDVEVATTHDFGEKNKRPVYNLSVEGAQEFFANGILVHNCHATVYYRVGIDRFGDSGGIVAAQSDPEPNSYFVNPDQTVDFNPNDLFHLDETLNGDSHDWRDN